MVFRVLRIQKPRKIVPFKVVTRYDLVMYAALTLCGEDQHLELQRDGSVNVVNGARKKVWL